MKEKQKETKQFIEMSRLNNREEISLLKTKFKEIMQVAKSVKYAEIEDAKTLVELKLNEQIKTLKHQIENLNQEYLSQKQLLDESYKNNDILH